MDVFSSVTRNTMRRNLMLGMMLAVSAAVAALIAQSSQTPPPGGGGQGGAQAAPGRGGGQRGAATPTNPADTFGTTDTLFTMPEAGQGSAANDPTAEQLAASAEAQAIIANAKRLAGADLAAEANRFCTWNANA